MYKIMLVTSHRDRYESLYKFKTEVVHDEVLPVELQTKEDLDAYVEEMLNNEGYSKKDFIIVRVIDYDIDARNYQV